VVRVRVPARFAQSHDDRLGLSVIGHLLWARSAASYGGAPFPLTNHAIAAVARRLGHGVVGQKRCAAIRARLVEGGILVHAGAYREGYSKGGVFTGHRVDLWEMVPIGRAAPGKDQASGRRRRRVKQFLEDDCFEHVLFGMPDGRPPPGLRRPGKRKWTLPRPPGWEGWAAA
jgi:hypothetical protein